MIDPSLVAAEDRANQFLEGGRCTLQEHAATSDLDKLVMLKALRIADPNQSTNIVEIEIAIRRELRKGAPKQA